MRAFAIALLSACALGASAAVASTGGEAPAPAPQPRELLVRFDPGQAAQPAVESVGGTVVERLGLRGLVRIRLDGRLTVAEAEAALEQRAGVRYAEPNHRYELLAAPNDTYFGDEWGLHQPNDFDIDAPEAWNVTTGSNAVTVAVVDSGVEYTHPDLVDNVWANPLEVANGSDDDGNGLVDDLRGWDFYSNDNVPLDLEGHGTHVAGTIGATGNNGIGVTGVNWRVKLIPLRVGNATLSDSAIVEAFVYACAKGAKIVNGSFGGPYSQAIHDAIAACPSALFVFAAGNDGDDNDRFVVHSHPCEDGSPNVLCVAASNASDGLADFSNYGLTTVDLAAPGEDIASTFPTTIAPYDYAYASGTSMAAPHVAGAAALVLANRPTLTPQELKNALLLSVDAKPAFAGRVVTGGRLNVATALGQEVQPPVGLTASTPSHGSGWSNNPTVQVVWGGATDASGIGGYSYAFSPVPTFVPDETQDAGPAVTTLTMPLADGEHWFHIRARDGEGNWGDAVHVGPIRIDTFAPVRPVASSPSHQLGVASADRTVDVAWNGGSDPQSGLDGYSISWTQGSAAAADLTKDVEEAVARATSTQLAVGAWWFNIRARDNAGNWSDTVSIGPFSIRSGPTACAVPRLRGLTLLGAKRLLAKRGCSLGRVTRVRSRRVRRGHVVAQRPAPGLRLARGARVRVVLSRGRR